MAVFRVEKTKDFTVMCSHHLHNVKLSLKAKGLLSLMLSLPEDWDYTTKGLSCICKDGVDSIGSTLKELEQNGYLTRQRIRFENGRLGDIEYTIHEKPVSRETEWNLPEWGNSGQGKPGQEKPEWENPEQVKPISIYSAEPEAARSRDGMDQIDLVEAYRKIICENVEYGILAERYGEQRMDETVELMLEIILSKRSYIRIAGDDFPREVVRSRFLKINSSHVEYVFGCIDSNTTKVGNIKAYLLAALYNAPATMDSYYRAEVNHGLYGK